MGERLKENIYYTIKLVFKTNRTFKQPDDGRRRLLQILGAKKIGFKV